jgi:translation initiation factor IF-3
VRHSRGERQVSRTGRAAESLLNVVRQMQGQGLQSMSWNAGGDRRRKHLLRNVNGAVEDFEKQWNPQGPLLLFLCAGRRTLLREDTAINNNFFYVNEQIRDREVRVIGEHGEMIGIMSSQDALKAAQEAGLDLVKVSPNAKPPVCKIIDYGKFRYEQARKEKEAKKKQKVTEIKEIRMSPNIDTNDLQTKTAAARKFLERGDRVKITLRFRGREMAHMNAHMHILTDFANSLTDIAIVEKAPKVEGRTMTMFLTQKKN